jgi:hypothetical protein
MELFLSMGVKPGGRVASPLTAVVRCVSVPDGHVVRDLACVSPIALTSGPGADQECTAASWLPDGVLLQPTHTEVLWVCIDTWRVIHRASHPLMHNVHSATPVSDGGYLVTCAGSDSVLTFDRSDVLVACDWLRDGDFHSAYGDIVDFRTLHHDQLKPHAYHPNHACLVGDKTWVTCFETQRAVCREDGREILFPEGIPHDGRLRDGLLWFTVVTGHVIAVDPTTLERRVHLDLNRLTQRESMLGWCRGVEIVGRRLFVGMTMIRATRHREVMRWLARGGAGRKLPTRVIEIDLDTEAIVREIPVGNEAGGTIYAINARGS